MLLRRVVPFLSLIAVSSVAGQEPHAVTGVPIDSEAGRVPLRKNINDMEAIGGAQWDLYIRALAAMHVEDSSNPLSYFQMMGIHGKPYLEWNGGGEKKTDEWQGYCPHGDQEKLFLPWHRPFVLLYEQVLIDHAKRIAQEYPQRYRYQYIRAAEELRSPFWDWGLDTEVPPATVPETLRVNIPNGEILEEVEIDNPLMTFRFPKEALDGKYGSFDSDNRTQIDRCPEPESYPNSADQKISSRPYKRWIYECFTHAKNFADFASTGDSGISLEQIHNGIHWDGACGGQFLASDFSAFDPLFMLHHTNVDRLWAYWQAMSPDHSIFHDTYDGGARYSTPRGSRITADSPLNPFFKSDGGFHTTRSVEKIQNFGYSYQGLEYWEKSSGEMRQEAKRLINRWYGPEETESTSLQRRWGNETTRYFAAVQVDVAELERPCIVDLYVGGQKVGGFVVMEQPKSGILHGGFPLDKALEASGISTLSPDRIVQSIQSSIEISIVKRDGGHIGINSVPGLQVDIEGVLVTLPTAEDELPSYGMPRRRPAATEEREEIR